MFEVLFLYGLALIWILFAIIQDIKTTEICNWVSYSLIIFAMGFRFFYSLFALGNFKFFYYGLIGLAIFFIIGNLFYYSKIFAGGDSRLMIALGAIIPIQGSPLYNLKILGIFILLFFISGAIYGIFATIFVGLKNFKLLKKELSIQFEEKRKFVILILIFACIFLGLGFVYRTFFNLGILLFLIPYFYLFAISVEKSCMIKNVKPSQLTEGDWLYEDVKIGKKLIKSKWRGLTKEEIKLLKRKKFIKIHYGIPFSPAFLIAFILLILFLKLGIIDRFFSLF